MNVEQECGEGTEASEGVQSSARGSSKCWKDYVNWMSKSSLGERDEILQ